MLVEIIIHATIEERLGLLQRLLDERFLMLDGCYSLGKLLLEGERGKGDWEFF